MMMAIDSSTNNHSPRSLVTSTPLESCGTGNDNAGGPVKPVWNKPSNGVVQEVVAPVMGADSWPALSKSTTTTTKQPLPKSSSSSSDDSSSKAISNVSVSVSQGPVVSQPEKQVNTNASHKFYPNPNHTQRQRSAKRGGGNGGGFAQRANLTLPPPQQPPLPPPFPVFETPYRNIVPTMMDTRPMGGVGSQFRPLNDHSSQRNSSRTQRSNFGPRPGGDGLYHNGRGGRRDQWNASRGSTARDMHVSQQIMAPPPARGFMRPPFPGSAPFITPQHVRPFGNQMGFDMAPPYLYVPTLPPESSFRGVPFLHHAPPQPMPLAASPLPTLLVNQIDYYFSDANLVKDDFLRSHMDDQGCVPISLIANFPRVQNLTKNIQLILDSLRTSTVVEVQGDKVRRRNGWEKWIPSTSSRSADSGSQMPAVSSNNMVATSV